MVGEIEPEADTENDWFERCTCVSIATNADGFRPGLNACRESVAENDSADAGGWTTMHM